MVGTMLATWFSMLATNRPRPRSFSFRVAAEHRATAEAAIAGARARMIDDLDTCLGATFMVRGFAGRVFDALRSAGVAVFDVC